MEENLTEKIAWGTIVGDNTSDDPLKDIFERTESKEITRKPKGRPKKSITPVSEPPTPIPMTPQEPVQPETMISNADLASMFTKSKSQSPKPRKSSLKFSGDQSETIPETDGLDPERVTLLKMYKQYFKKPLIDKHNRKEKIWQDHQPNSEIYQEIRLLENSVSDDDPAVILSSFWVTGMSVVENLGDMWGLETESLTQVSVEAAKLPHFQANMRELLIKYPYLRTMIALGGYPELKLLVTTVTLVKEVHQLNIERILAKRGVNPDAPIPNQV